MGEYRRKITAVFADLVGSTGLAESLDPEVFRELVLTFLERMASVVERHGGSIEHLAGDGVMGVFGAERAHGDDASRAVRSAAAMLEELDDLNHMVEAKVGVRLAMRIGVNTGTVVVGRAVAGHQVSVGDPMNVAARLQAEAPEGGILIGAETHRMVAREVRAEPAGELDLRGRRERLAAFRVLGIEPAKAAVPLSERPLVGRGRELGLLTVAFERSAARGAREFVTLLGDAGAGKSRLVAELVARYRERATLLVGRCLSYGEGITYWPVAELARQAAGIAGDDGPEEAREKLAQVSGGGPDGQAITGHLAQLLGIDPVDEPGEQTAWAVRRLLERIADSAPLIVVIEDLHWAESKLLELLLEIAETIEGPVVLVCMARFDLLERRPDWERACPTMIPLRPLAPGETDEVVELLIGDALPGRHRARLVELAAGNPLFVEQVLHMLVDEGRLRADGDRWEVVDPTADVEVPPSIEAILAARVDHLSGPERTCAESAAVVGMEFWASGVEDLAGDAAPRALASLERKLVIEPVRRPGATADLLRFRHLLLRDAVYEAIPKARRAELHERVGEWLLEWASDRRAEIEEIVGYHFEAAARYSSELLTRGDAPDRLAARAVEHLTAAGRRAAARQDDEEAAGFFRRSVALLGEGNPTRLEPLIELGSALVRGGDTEPAAAVVADARRAAATAGDPRLDAEVRTLEVNLRRLTNPRWWAANGRSEAAELASIYRELGDDAGSAKAWHLLGKAHSDRGEQAAAQEAFEHALEFAERAGDPGIAGWIRYWLIQAAVLGPMACEDVVARAREDLEWARAHRNRSLEGSILARMGEMLARSGRASSAAEAFVKARRVLEEIDRPSHLAYLALSVAAVEPLASDPAAAERELRPAFEFFDEVGAEHINATVAPMLASTLVPQGRTDEAIELTALAERISAPDDLDGQVKWRTARAAALSLNGEHAEAERFAREAVALVEPTDTVILEADALAGLGSVLMAAGAAGEATEPIERAAALYEAKGDTVSAGRWRATLADLVRTR